MTSIKIKIIIVFVAFILMLGIPSLKPGSQIQKVTKKPENFTEGVWIKKYPGNYACFKFETPDGIKIVCDPYNMDEIVSADIVTESHQDADHNDKSKITGHFTLLKEPGEYVVKGIHIIGIPGKHNKPDKGMSNIIFIFEIEGIKIAHFASQGAPLDSQMLQKLQGIDVLLIQGTLSELFREQKLTDGDCIRIIKQIHPYIVIPEHGTSHIGECLAKQLGTKVEYAPPSGIVILKKDLKPSGVLEIVDMDY